ncbi:hypothetical protein OM076_28945, partial [Solirubrobacter ginsenosidimutans]
MPGIHRSTIAVAAALALTAQFAPHFGHASRAAQQSSYDRSGDGRHDAPLSGDDGGPGSPGPGGTGAGDGGAPTAPAGPSANSGDPGNGGGGGGGGGAAGGAGAA